MMGKRVAARMAVQLGLVALTAALLGGAGYAADLRIMTDSVGGKDAQEMQAFAKELSDDLGFEVELVKPEFDYENVLFTTLSSGESYDLIYGESSYIPKFVDQGAVQDLTDIVARSPVLSDRKEIPDAEWNLFKTADGRLYGVPTKFGGGTMPIVREDWIKAWGMKDPVSLDDWEALFKRCKDEKNAYGLSVAGLYDIQGFMSAAGVKAGYKMVDGKRTVPYADDAAATVYDWFGKMYKAGYLDPQFATNEPADFRKEFLTDRACAVTYWDAWTGIFDNIARTDNPSTAFEAKGLPGVPGPDGKVLLRRGEVSLWFLPANAQHVDNAVKFLEFWHSPKGYILGSLGVKGVDYNIAADGKYELTEVGKSHSMDHGISFSESTTWQNPLGVPAETTAAQKVIVDSDAKIELRPIEWDDAEPIIEKYAYAAMSGQMSGADAVKQMRADLKNANLID